MDKITLFFDTFLDKELEDKLTGKGQIIRLWCWACFKTKNGWTTPYPALVDSGAHTTIIPKKIWSMSQIVKLTDHYVRGLVPIEECKIDVDIGEINVILCDKSNCTDSIKMLSYFALTDEVPVILGFKDLLSKFKVCFDYQNNEAYIELKK